MPGYYETRMRAILNAPYVPRAPDDATQPKKQRHMLVSLDNDTIKWIEDRAPSHWRLMFLNALAYANPTLDCWIDTRPHELRAATVERLARGLYPLWTEGTERVTRRCSYPLAPEALAIYANVADNYGITTQQYMRIFGKWEGVLTPRLETDQTIAQKLAAVLRAVGGGYLTPRHMPHLNYKPKLKPRPNRPPQRSKPKGG